MTSTASSASQNGSAELDDEEPGQHRPESEERELGEVDDVHDAEDEGDADRSEGVDVPSEQAGDQGVEHDVRLSGAGQPLYCDPLPALQDASE